MAKRVQIQGPDLTRLIKLQKELDQIHSEINSRFDKGRNWLGSSKEKNQWFQRKKAWEGRYAGEAQLVYDARMAEIDASTTLTKPQKAALKRHYRELPDSGIMPSDNLIQGAGQQRVTTRDTQYNLDAMDTVTEQGRGTVKTDYGHVKSVAGDPADYIAEPTPTTFSYRPPSKKGDPIKKHIQVRQRGADTGKTAFPESKRYNVHMGPKDSFSLTQMEDLGRAKNWTEAVAFDGAFENRDMIDIDPIDWMRLQQKDITTEDLVWHKQRVADLAAQNDIFLDALSTEDGIRVIDYRQGKESLQRHFKKKHFPGKKQSFDEADNLASRMFRQQVLDRDPKTFKVTKLNPGEGLKVGLSKATGRLSRVEAFTMLGANLASGNVPGAVINAGMISGKLLAQSPAVQKRFAELAVRMVQERTQKSAMKMIPGVDILLSGAEAWDYAVQGRWDQATLATISGAIGWAGPVGDLAAAFIDMTNTTLDISRGDFSSIEKQEGPEVVGSNIKQRRTVEAIGRDIKQSTTLGKVYRMSK